jgi:hypothetical protein
VFNRDVHVNDGLHVRAGASWGFRALVKVVTHRKHIGGRKDVNEADIRKMAMAANSDTTHQASWPAVLAVLAVGTFCCWNTLGGSIVWDDRAAVMANRCFYKHSFYDTPQRIKHVIAITWPTKLYLLFVGTSQLNLRSLSCLCMTFGGLTLGIKRATKVIVLLQC